MNATMHWNGRLCRRCMANKSNMVRPYSKTKMIIERINEETLAASKWNKRNKKRKATTTTPLWGNIHIMKGNVCFWSASSLAVWCTRSSHSLHKSHTYTNKLMHKVCRIVWASVCVQVFDVIFYCRALSFLSFSRQAIFGFRWYKIGALHQTKCNLARCMHWTLHFGFVIFGQTNFIVCSTRVKIRDDDFIWAGETEQRKPPQKNEQNKSKRTTKRKIIIKKKLPDNDCEINSQFQMCPLHIMRYVLVHYISNYFGIFSCA